MPDNNTLNETETAECGKNVAIALTHIENNMHLSVSDLRDGDGYETLEYLENIRTWILEARQQLSLLTGKGYEEIKNARDDE